MKRVMYAAVVAVGCSVAASAQSGMGADKMSQGKMAKESAKTMMVTGCVAESGGKFMLNNAMMSDMAGSGMASGSPAPMASGSPMAMSYMLSGGTLKPHVGHKVEITGMMKPMSKDDMGKGGMGKDMPKDSMSKDMPRDSKGTMAKDDMMKKDAMGMAGTIDVKNVKTLATTCS